LVAISTGLGPAGSEWASKAAMVGVADGAVVDSGRGVSQAGAAMESSTFTSTFELAEEATATDDRHALTRVGAR
jgi:hypothetical protein